MSKIKVVLFLICNMLVASTVHVRRVFYLSLKQGFVKSEEIEFTTLTKLNCGVLCLLSHTCCGFDFNHTNGRCLLLTKCSYGSAKSRGIAYFVNGLSGDQCLRENLALNKPCGQSSVYKNDPTFACYKANDGSLSEHIHTVESGWEQGESYPYWWVDMQTTRSVKEVVVHNRRTYHYYRLHNVRVTVGEDLSQLYQCGYHDGPAPDMDPLYFTCEPEVKGRYLQIMIMDESAYDNFLTITEVEVYDCWP